jgi:hypothetical protein
VFVWFSATLIIYSKGTTSSGESQASFQVFRPTTVQPAAHPSTLSEHRVIHQLCETIIAIRQDVLQIGRAQFVFFRTAAIRIFNVKLRSTI